MTLNPKDPEDQKIIEQMRNLPSYAGMTETNGAVVELLDSVIRTSLDAATMIEGGAAVRRPTKGWVLLTLDGGEPPVGAILTSENLNPEKLPDILKGFIHALGGDDGAN